MKKLTLWYIFAALLVTVGMYCFINGIGKEEQEPPFLTEVDRLVYDADHAECSPKSLFENDEATADDIRTLLFSLGLDERFASLLREQTLKKYAESDVLRVVASKRIVASNPEDDEKKDIVMRLTVADVGENAFVSIDVEIPALYEQRFEDVIGVATNVPMIIDQSSYCASIQIGDQESVSLVLGEDYSAYIADMDMGVGFSFDLSKLTKNTASGTVVRLHFEYKATYKHITTTYYNVLLCYEHLTKPHDGITNIGKTNEGVCYKINDNSAIVSDRHFFLTPEPFLAFPE